MSSSRSSSRSSNSATEPLPTLRTLYSQAARAFLNRAPLLPTYIDRAFSLLPPPHEHECARESAGLAIQRVKWDVLRLTWEASVYPLHGATANGNGKGKGKEGENGHAKGADMLSLPPAILLPALHARSIVLFTPASQKASSTYLPAEVLLALVLFALKLGLYSVARDWIELWWVVRGSEERESQDELAGRKKIRECMVLRVLPGLQDWESAEGWANAEKDVAVREQLLSSLEFLKSQAAQEAAARTRQMSSSFSSSYLPSRTPLPPSPSPSSSRATPTPSPSRTPPPRPSSPASSTSSTATHSTHTATPATPQPARTGLTLTPTGTIRGPPRQGNNSNTAVPIPPSAPPIAQGIPPPPSILRALLQQLRQSFSRIAWLFIILIPLVGLMMRLRAAKGRGATRRRRGDGSGNGVIGGATAWLWRALRDAVDMAGRGLV